MYRGKRFLRLLLFCFLFFLPVTTWAADMETTGPSISWSEWNALKADLTAQTADLAMLREKWNLLKMNSTELQILTDRLQTKLMKAESSLMNTETSLAEVRKELEASRSELEALKAKAKEEEHKKAVLRRQRDTWAVVAAITLGYAIT